MIARAAFSSVVCFALFASSANADNIDCEALVGSKIIFRAISSSQSNVESSIDVIRKEDNKTIAITRSPLSGVTIRRYTGPVTNTLETPHDLTRTMTYNPELTESKIEGAKRVIIDVAQANVYAEGSKTIFGEPNKNNTTHEKIQYDFIGHENVTVKNCAFDTLHYKETHVSARNTDYSTIWQEFWYSPELGISIKNVELIWDINTKQRYGSTVTNFILKK